MLSRNIVLWVLTGFVGVLSSCATTNPDEVSGWELAVTESTEDDQFDEQFSTTNLSEQNLSAFESRGIQKLEDFYELLGIVGDPSYDSAFRKQAVSLALDLFNPDEAILSQEGESTMSLTEYLEGVFKTRQALKYGVKNISLSSPFSKESDDRYHAELSYQLHQEEDTLKMNVVLVKKPKLFGQDKRYVWEVLLAGIK